MKKRIVNIFGITLLLVALSTTPVVAPVQVTSAHTGNAVYTYLVGHGFLCDLDPSACPAIARADNGDTMEIFGGGTMSLAPNTATGSGRFTHKLPDGTVLATGTWVAQRLLSFQDYGCGGFGLPDNFCGGRALIRVHLLSDSGVQSPGILEVDCVLGDNIPPEAVEGVQLLVTKFNFNFDEEVSGFTLFIKKMPWDA